MKDYLHCKYDIPSDLSESVIREWLSVHQDAWYELDTKRERMAPALASTRSYYLRVPAMFSSSMKTTESSKDVVLCVDTGLFALFPQIRRLIDWSAKHRTGKPWKTLGRVFITKLAADSSILRHTDSGGYFDQLHRHHFVLSSAGSQFCWDGEEASLTTGECWLVNNSVPHWVRNGPQARTHLIFDAA